MRELAQSASKRKTSDSVGRDDVKVIDTFGATISPGGSANCVCCRRRMISKSLGININREFNLRLPHSECRLIVCSAACLEGEYVMPRFYFHLSAPGQDFRDSIGCDVNDLSTAHSRAVQLADRVMMYSAFASRAVEFRRCTVKVTDDRQRSVMTVIFPADFVLGKCNRRSASGARTSFVRLDEMLTPGEPRRCYG
jgi:hypothetical protein